MAKNDRIRSVELVRQIRDEHAKRLENSSDEEIIAFFHRAGARARAGSARHPRVESQVATPGA